jgi:hypothetical protein
MSPPLESTADGMLLLQQQPQYHIIGDVYVDILCYIPSCAGNNNSNHSHHTTSVLTLDGTDTALTQPITIMAGGSTINTATYLQYLQNLQLSASVLDITVHTAFNPNDYYGSILMQHSKANHITLKNGCSNDIFMNSSEQESPQSLPTLQEHPQQQQQQQQQLSTPHCMVMISSSSTTTTAAAPSNAAKESPSTNTTTTTTTISSERTFLTHRGCATNNMWIQKLFPSSLSLSSPSVSYTNGGSSITGIRPLHYHIAGYYCTPEFWNTAQNSLSLFVANIFQYPTTAVNENGCSHSNTGVSPNSATTASPATSCPPIILSLVTQYDATQQWDISNLMTILPYMHVCIMNELEAQQIYYSNYHDDSNCNSYTNNTDDVIDPSISQLNENVDSKLLGMISFFTKFNPSTIYVITQGVKGAIAFRNQSIIAQVLGTVNVTSILGNHSSRGVDDNTTRNSNVIIDPTGAGDAFCAGFFHSLWQSIQYTNVLFDMDLYRPSEQYWPQASAIQDALLYGCTIGTCSILQRGGSTVPASGQNLVQIIHEQYRHLRRPLANGDSQDHR